MDRLVKIRPKPAAGFVPKAVGQSDEKLKENDGVIARVLKFVPSETVAGYVPLISAAEAITNDAQLQFRLACIALFAGVLFTPLYLIRVGKPRGFFEWLNIGVATLAFVLWAYLLGGPFAMAQMNHYLWAYDKRVAGFVVGLFTWGVALVPYESFAPKKDREAASGA